MVWVFLAVSEAGQLACSTGDTFYAYDTRRDGAEVSIGYASNGYSLGDIAFDSQGLVIYAEAFGLGFPDCLMAFDLGSRQSSCLFDWAGGGVSVSPQGGPLLFPRNAEWLSMAAPGRCFRTQSGFKRSGAAWLGMMI